MAVKRKSWIQPSAAAKYFGVTSSTIRQWISDGKLRAVKLPTGHLRILVRDVIKYLLQQGKPIPVELGNLANKSVLIVDPDSTAANTMAAALRGTSGCKVTVAETAPDVRGLLNGSRPDLILLGVRRSTSAGSNGSGPDMLILACGTDDPPAKDADEQEIAFRVNDILPTPVDEQVLVSRVAHVLLG